MMDEIIQNILGLRDTGDTAPPSKQKIKEIIEAIIAYRGAAPEPFRNVVHAVLDHGDDDLQHRKSWALAHFLHRKGFIELVREKPQVAHGLDNAPSYDYRVSIAEMQRMYMRALQIRLVHTAVLLQTTPAIEYSGETPNHADDDVATNEANNDIATKAATTIGQLGNTLRIYLREYTQAVQDYEYMTAVSQKPFDYFVATPERCHDKSVINSVCNDLNKEIADLFYTALDNERGLENMKKKAIVTGPWEDPDKPESLGGTRNAAAQLVIWRERWGKLSAAAVGGAFLIGPMWLLVLRRELYLHLGVVTAFVSGFGLLMVWYVDKVEHVFASTLAYAAVLMVFVGVSLDKLFPETAAT